MRFLSFVLFASLAVAFSGLDRAQAAVPMAIERPGKLAFEPLKTSALGPAHIQLIKPVPSSHPMPELGGFSVDQVFSQLPAAQRAAAPASLADLQAILRQAAWERERAQYNKEPSGDQRPAESFADEPMGSPFRRRAISGATTDLAHWVKYLEYLHIARPERQSAELNEADDAQASQRQQAINKRRMGKRVSVSVEVQA